MKYFQTLFFCLVFIANMISQEHRWDTNMVFTTENILKVAGNTPKIIHISQTVLVRDSVIIPQNVTLQFTREGKLRIVNEATRLILNGPINAGIQHIFDVGGHQVTSYRFESVSNIKMSQTNIFYPEWWGIFPEIIPGQNGDTGSNIRHHLFMKEMMLDIAASGGGTLQFSEGAYYIRDIVVDSDNITVLGKGKKTILRHDRDNFGTSTRRGGIFTIQGPTLEKYYSKVFPDGTQLAGNFLYDNKQYPIDNIIVRDLAIEWHPESSREDPTMNGLTVVNTTNVLIDNVHIDLAGANRAFYIGSIFDGDVTENVTIKNSVGINCRTGVFIVHGYDNKEFIRNKMSLGNILIENNTFDLVELPDLNLKNDHVTIKYIDTYKTGIYFIGNEFTQSFQLDDILIERNMGPVKIINNTFNDADMGVRSWLPGKDERKDYRQNVSIEGNTFNNFRYFGIIVPFKDAVIKNNTFKVKQLAPVPQEFTDANEEAFVASAIHIAKSPWKIFKSKQGPMDILIEDNKIEGCYLGVSPIVLQPNNDGVIKLLNNEINYDSSCTIPQNDIVVTTSRKKFRTKKATIILENNTRDASNQTTEKASILLDVRRKKHITLIETNL